MEPLRIGDLELPTPIIQGGMGVGVSLSGLAAAVADEGGLGIISAVGIGMTEPGYRKNFRESNKIALRKEIRKAREKNNGAIGINIMMAVSDFEELLAIALEEEVDAIIISAGLPLRMPACINPDILKRAKTKIIPKVSSARAAKLIFHYWSTKYKCTPNAIIVEGPHAGGHLGFKPAFLDRKEDQLENIILSTLEVIEKYEMLYNIEIPLIAGGGIYNGKDIYRMIELGAKGVKMGTRFVTTWECDAAMEFKNNYLDCKEEDITLIQSPVGLPGRVIRNSFVDQIQAGIQKPVNCPWKCLKTCDFKKVQFCIAEALFSAAKGDFSKGFSFAGTKAYMAQKIMTVKETIDQLKREYLVEKHQLNLITT